MPRSCIRRVRLAVPPVVIALVATLTACSETSPGSTHVAPTQPSFTIGTELAPIVKLSPDTLSFGQQAVNVPSTWWQSVRIDNVGTADLVITDFSIAGPQYAEFTVNKESYAACPIDAPLAPGQYCTVLVKFEPTAVGPRLGSLIVSGNAGSPTMFLTGEGVIGTDGAVSLTAAQTGKSLSYTIVVKNLGPGDAKGVTVFDAIPSGTTFVGLAVPSDLDCFQPTPGSSTGSVNCNIPSLASGSSRTLRVDVKLSGAVKSRIENTVTIDVGSLDPVASNNVATVTTGRGRQPSTRGDAAALAFSASPTSVA